MRPEHLRHLACPACRGPLTLQEQERDGPHVLSGALRCAACGVDHPLRGGIPRFAGAPGERLAPAVAARFAGSWRAFPHLLPEFERQFFDWIAPFGPDDLRGAVVLEAGCGKGRHTRVIAGCAPEVAIALDLGDVVELAFANTAHDPRALVVQGDILHPPLPVGSVDLCLSVGVIHHLPAPGEGTRSLRTCLRPGGRMVIWVYGRENNGWIVHVVSPVRERVTSRLPNRLLRALCFPPAVGMFALTQAYRRAPAALAGHLPYAPYLRYIGMMPLHEQHSIVHDHLVTPVAYYLRREEVQALLEQAGLVDVQLRWHGTYSWTGWGRAPA